LLALGAAAGAGRAQGAGAPFCHADVLVKNMDFDALTISEKSVLGPSLAKAIAFQNGISPSDVMSPTKQPGNVGFFSGSYVAPWSPPNRRPYTQGKSTIVSSLIGGCNLPEMMLGVFKTPAVHTAITETVTSTLQSSAALQGPAQVLGVAVVPDSRAPAAATPAPALPAVTPPPDPPIVVAPPAGSGAAPAPQAAPAPVAPTMSGATPPGSGLSAVRAWLLPAIGALCALVVAFGICSLARRPKDKRAPREYADLAAAEESDAGH